MVHGIYTYSSLESYKAKKRRKNISEIMNMESSVRPLFVYLFIYFYLHWALEK